jgi:hypothetical protein
VTAAWNLLVYAIAADDEELGRVEQAIKDMHAALPANTCNVAVQVHARSKTTRTWISGGIVRKERLAVQDSSDWATLKNFLNAANHNFSKKTSGSQKASGSQAASESQTASGSQKANMTALILWAHSTGLDDLAPGPPRKAAGLPGLDALFAGRAGSAHDPGVDVEELAGHAPEPAVAHHPRHYGCSWGPDPNTGGELTVPEVKQAISASTRHRVEILGLNACGMAFLEVVHELRNVADVQVASQVEARPWPYGAIVQTLVKSPEMTPAQLAIAIVDTVRTEIATGRTDAISALESGKAVDDLATALEAYARRVDELIDVQWPLVSKAVMKDAWRVDDPYMVDLVSLLQVLGRDDLKAKAASNTVARAFRAMCLAAATSTGHPHIHGLSIFCPKTTYRDIADVYQGLEFRNHSWRGFLLRFQRKLPRPR